tara:strand:+ start:967 stop:1401 length:435 start_codon:yes stop_codon:yes gene_type:complete
MKLIAHRGNTAGPNKRDENMPNYIMEALNAGYDAEIDVWKVSDGWFLGHDGPIWKVDIEFLKTSGLWCHAKNLEALESMIECGVHCFWHDSDDYTLTSQGYVWAYPGNPLGPRSICVMPEKNDFKDMQDCYGICSDFIGRLGEE